MMVLALLIIFIGSAFSRTTAEWKTRSIYQILTDRFNNPYGGTCNNLGNYCGGTFKGIQDKLDYIQDLGFDAIWISPIVTNTPGGYHGYWASDIYGVNPKFGSAQDLKDLVNECHRRNIYVMLDVVANHMGSCSSRWDFSCLTLFNSREHFHNYDCDIVNWGNQWEVENCRLAGLPDLNHENSWVTSQLTYWASWVVKEYKFDGLRVDTIVEVPQWFWTQFNNAAGVFTIGEAFNGDPAYIGKYTNQFASIFNYPLYWTLRDVFGRGRSCYNLKNYIASMPGYYKDVTALANFIDNHDNPRWLYELGNDWERYRTAMVFMTTFHGIPVAYYGSEKGYAGGQDPYNRETMWTSGWSVTGNPLYETTRTITRMRRKNYKSWNLAFFTERYVLDDFYAFSRGEVFVTLTNRGKYSGGLTWVINNTPFNPNTEICNVFAQTDCIRIGSNGSAYITLVNNEPKVWVPKAEINNYRG